MTWMVRDDEESDAIQELYTGSDRGAAIIAAAIVDARLTEAIKNRLVQDPKAEKELFRSSGPLGTFSAKIHLARLLGVCSEDAYRDLNTMREVRNKFAHNLQVRSFDGQPISDLCTNFRLIQKCVQEAVKGQLANPHKMNSVMGVEGRDDKIKDTKWRYLLTAMLFSGSLVLRRGSGPNI